MKHRGFNQHLIWLLITVHLVTVYGCTATNHVTLSGNEMPVGSNLKIATVILKDGEIIEFDSGGGLCVEKTKDGKPYRAIVGMTHSKKVEIDREKVLELKVDQKESSGLGSFVASFLIGMPVGVGILVLIVYSRLLGHRKEQAVAQNIIIAGVLLCLFRSEVTFGQVQVNSYSDRFLVNPNRQLQRELERFLKGCNCREYPAPATPRMPIDQC